MDSQLSAHAIPCIMPAAKRLEINTLSNPRLYDGQPSLSKIMLLESSNYNDPARPRVE